ncbi:MAG: queuosine precursor transporter [Holosporales bacterium]|nr:queuosine precursor transporter [Holosporales bacterium]
MWQYSPEFISLATLLTSLGFLEGLFRIAGKSGLCAYNCIAVCIANIQVLHITKYDLMPMPVPLGTVLFTTTFLSNNMISAKYGSSEAQKSVILSFVVYAFFSISLILSLMHKPLQGDAFLQESYQNYLAIKRLFTPSIRILCASLISFLLSQYFNILFFVRINKILTNVLHKGTLPWIRRVVQQDNANLRQDIEHGAQKQAEHWNVSSLVSVFLSGALDNLIFSSLAFYFWGTVRPSISMLFNGYVLETTVIRCVVIFVSFIVFRTRMSEANSESTIHY